ncbi:DUF4229 domain-containing protein [Chlamydiifrater volucris]|uniref:DUF4229 domain-containing protein n=1 Tax=Chlamydiifrater volucris TaxID=2681470 RepID=UPI001BCDE423|nr:DUF4229 domain-containing protein [Chlamydiifrater volucris]
MEISSFVPTSGANLEGYKDARIVKVYNKISWIEVSCLAIAVMGAVFFAVGVLLGEGFLLAVLLATAVTSIASFLFFKRQREKNELITSYVKREFLPPFTPPEESIKYQRSGPIIASLMDMDIKWPHPWHLEDYSIFASMNVKKSDTVKFRSLRDLAYIFLGFFSWEELTEFLEFVFKRYSQVDDLSIAMYDRLYAECIKRFPKVVAVEAAHFAWLKECYPYLGKAFDAFFINKEFSYRSEFFSRLHGLFEKEFCMDRVAKIDTLEKFRGWVPVCLSSLSLGKELNTSSRWDMDWKTFCRKVSQFCFLSHKYRGAYGQWDKFQQFVEEGAAKAFSECEEINFEYEIVENNLFEEPEPLWNLGSICEEDRVLVMKIEEGLEALDHCGYLGKESLDKVKAFERQILGIKKF